MNKPLLTILLTIITTAPTLPMHNKEMYVILCPKLETTKESAITSGRKTSDKLPNSIGVWLSPFNTPNASSLKNELTDFNIHSKKYLNNLTEHSSIMHAAIFNNVAMGLMPNWYSERSFKSIKHNIMLEVRAKVAITKALLSRQLHCVICPFGGYSYAGHNQGSNGHIYADIPTAAACAIKNNTCQNILVIDQLRNNDLEHYNKHGNGTIFNTLPLFKHDDGTSKILFDTYENTKPNLAFLTIAFDNTEPYLPTIKQLYANTIPMIITLFGHKTNDDNTLINNIITIEKTLAAIRTINNTMPEQETPIPTNTVTTTSSSSSNNSYQDDDYNDKTTSSSTSSSNDTDTSQNIKYAQLPSCNHSPHCEHAQYILKETARTQWMNAIEANKKNNADTSSNTEDSNDSEESMDGFALFGYSEH